MHIGVSRPVVRGYLLLASALVATSLVAAHAQAPGDVNCDGQLNSDDVPALTAVVFGDAASNCGASDVNGDGEVNAPDVVALLRALDPP